MILKNIFILNLLFTGKDLCTHDLGEPISTYVKGKVAQPANVKQRRFIITGGPGVGKTSIIKGLMKLGYITVSEAANDVIQEGLDKGVNEPWLETIFQTKVANLIDKRKAALKPEDGPIAFFDRGPVDGLSYILLLKKMYQHRVVENAQDVVLKPYFQLKVFFIEDLGTCQKNEIRHESLLEALRIGNRIKQDYKALGFDVISIPAGSIEQRVNWILEYIGEKKLVLSNEKVLRVS